MELRNLFLLISTIAGLISPLIGIRSIIKKEYKPHRISRIIFLIINTVIFTSLISIQDRTGIFIAFFQFTGSIVIFLLSLKFGVGGIKKQDIFILCIAVVTIIIWRTTNNPIVALYLGILSDFIGFIPTFIKSYRYPLSEDPKFYLSDTIAGFFSVLAVKVFLSQELAYPLYVFISNLFCLLILIRRNRSKSKIK